MTAPAPVPLAITKSRYGGVVQNVASGSNMVITQDWSETDRGAIDYLRTYYTGNLHVVFQVTWFASDVAACLDGFNQPQTIGTGTHNAVGLATVPVFPGCTLISTSTTADVTWTGSGAVPLLQGLWWANVAALGLPGAETIDLSSIYGVTADVLVMATIGQATAYAAHDSVEYGAGNGTIPALPGDYAAGILETQAGTYFTGSIIVPDATTADSYVYTSSYGAAGFGYLRAVAVQ